MKDKSFEKLPIRSINGVFNKSNTPHFNITLLTGDEPNTPVYVAPHRHDFYHIMLVKNGEGTHTIDFKSYDVVPNSIFFVSPGQIHTLSINKNALGYVISFDSDFFKLKEDIQKISNLPFFHSISQAPVVYLNHTNSTVLNLWDMLFSEHQKSLEDTPRMIRGLLDVLLISVSRIYQQNPIHSDISANLSVQLNKLDTLVDTHFRDLKQVKDYAELMHMSSKHLNSICKKGLNKTVTALIHERLTTEAKRLLLFTNNTIEEIAFELGFSDKSYFMRFFKKHTGSTAETFRKQHRT